MEFKTEKNLNKQKTEKLEKIKKLITRSLPFFLLALGFKSDNVQKIQKINNISEDLKIDNFKKDFISKDQDTFTLGQQKDSMPKERIDSINVDTVNIPIRSGEEITDTNIKEFQGELLNKEPKQEQIKQKNYLEKYNQKEIFESATDLADAIDEVLDNEKGFILYFVNKKLELHKKAVLNSIKTIDQFKKENKEYFDILAQEEVEIETDEKIKKKVKLLSENENIKFGQINALAMCYELYNNGVLKEIFSHGILEKVVFSTVFTKYQFYKKFHNEEIRIENNKLNDSESLKKIERFKGILKRNITNDEVRHILFLIEMVKELNKPIETIFQTPRDKEGFIKEGKKDISNFEEEEIRVMTKPGNEELINYSNELLDYFYDLKRRK